MTKTKDQYSQILQNQQNLMERLSENTNKLLSLYSGKEAADAFKTEIVEHYFNESKTYMTEVTKPENLEKFWEKWPETMNKAFEIQANFWKKGMDMYRNFWEKNSMEKQQKKLEEAKTIYEENFNAISDTTTKNFEVLSNFFKVEPN